MDTSANATPFNGLIRNLGSRTAVVAIIGLGYVGLPLAAAVGRASFCAIGFDVDEAKIEQLNKRISYIDAVDSAELSDLASRGKFRATGNFEELSSCDVVVVCVPTPLTRHREPDLQFVETTLLQVSRHLRAGQLVILEINDLPRHDGRSRQTNPGIKRPEGWR